MVEDQDFKARLIQRAEEALKTAEKNEHPDSPVIADRLEGLTRLLRDGNLRLSDVAEMEVRAKAIRNRIAEENARVRAIEIANRNVLGEVDFRLIEKRKNDLDACGRSVGTDSIVYAKRLEELALALEKSNTRLDEAADLRGQARGIRERSSGITNGASRECDLSTPIAEEQTASEDAPSGGLAGAEATIKNNGGQILIHSSSPDKERRSGNPTLLIATCIAFVLAGALVAYFFFAHQKSAVPTRRTAESSIASPEAHAQKFPTIAGTWGDESAGGQYSFYLYIEQDGKSIKGWFVAKDTTNGTDRNDAVLDLNNPGITGILHGNTATVNFHSSHGAVGTALLELDGDHLNWTINNTEAGPVAGSNRMSSKHYLPDTESLVRALEPSTNFWKDHLTTKATATPSSGVPPDLANCPPDVVVRDLYEVHYMAYFIFDDEKPDVSLLRYEMNYKGKGPFNTKDRACLDKYFEKKLADMIWKDKGEMMDADYLFSGNGGLEITDFQVGRPKIDHGHATVVVSFKNFGEVATTTLNLVNTSSGWKVSNVSQDGWDLVSQFKTKVDSDIEVLPSVSGENAVGSGTDPGPLKEDATSSNQTLQTHRQLACPEGITPQRWQEIQEYCFQVLFDIAYIPKVDDILVMGGRQMGWHTPEAKTKWTNMFCNDAGAQGDPVIYTPSEKLYDTAVSQSNGALVKLNEGTKVRILDGEWKSTPGKETPDPVKDTRVEILSGPKSGKVCFIYGIGLLKYAPDPNVIRTDKDKQAVQDIITLRTMHRKSSSLTPEEIRLHVLLEP